MMDCKGCPHYRPSYIDSCAASAHSADGTCFFEEHLEDFEDFQRWRYPERTDRHGGF